MIEVFYDYERYMISMWVMKVHNMLKDIKLKKYIWTHKKDDIVAYGNLI